MWNSDVPRADEENRQLEMIKANWEMATNASNKVCLWGFKNPFYWC